MRASSGSFEFFYIEKQTSGVGGDDILGPLIRKSNFGQITATKKYQAL